MYEYNMAGNCFDSLLVVRLRPWHPTAARRGSPLLRITSVCTPVERRDGWLTAWALITEIESLAAAARRAADRTGSGSCRADGKSPAAGSGVDALSLEERARTSSSLRRRADFL